MVTTTKEECLSILEDLNLCESSNTSDEQDLVLMDIP
jgi:hypothetical protein